MVTPSLVLFILLVREIDLGYAAFPTKFLGFVMEPSGKLRVDVVVGHEMIIDLRLKSHCWMLY
jgi:hypothetical protein